MLGVCVAFSRGRSHAQPAGPALLAAMLDRGRHPASPLCGGSFLRRFAAACLPPEMMMTMGFALVFRDGAFLIWGGDPFTLAYPVPFLRGSLELHDVVFPTYRLFVDRAWPRGVGALLGILNEKTLIGAKLRAAVDDPEMAAGTGIPVALLSGLGFRRGCRAGGVRRRHGRPHPRAAIRDDFDLPAAGLRGGDHRRHGQPERRRGGQHRASVHDR